MSGSCPLFESRCNLDQVRLKTLDLQLSGLFQTKAPQMTQCSSDVTVFNPNSLPDRSVPNPESCLSDKARSCPTDIDLDLILILDTRPLETRSYISSVMKKLYSAPPPLRFPSICIHETAPALFLYAATREDFLFLSCLEL